MANFVWGFSKAAFHHGKKFTFDVENYTFDVKSKIFDIKSGFFPKVKCSLRALLLSKLKKFILEELLQGFSIMYEIFVFFLQ